MNSTEFERPPSLEVTIGNLSTVSVSSSVFVKEKMENVWNKLVDYENLTAIVPYLQKSDVVSQMKNQTILYQESNKRILGLPYRNRMTLLVKENNINFYDRSIAFSLVKSNLFSYFDGIWNMKYYTDEYTLVNYTIHASTKIPVPFFLIKDKMGEVVIQTMNNVKNSF